MHGASGRSPSCAAASARSTLIVRQRAFVSGSVAENIALFAPVDADRLAHVLAQVRLTELVGALPMHERTPLGEIGNRFSAGEMQRLLLARALYRQPDYLFLDEATANLDAASAAVVADVVSGLSCTRLLVTHDGMLAARAERVLQLRDGRLDDVTDALRRGDGAAQNFSSSASMLTRSNTPMAL